MFNNQRYLTKGIQVGIPLELQIFMWNCIDRLPPERDYLQVFNLSQFGDLQRISHSSEQPKYHMEYLIPCDNPVTAKVYVIDNKEYSTMLLAEEY
ncbi:MAG: DUF960 domain-containing protein [Ruminococcus sp.]|nr:DUF960 domain-containing protein [Ruminococcus sp.]